MSELMVSSLPTFRTDFNKRDAHGRIVAAFGHYWVDPGLLGARARVEDAEGNSCDALVEAIDGQLVFLLPLWQTWTDGSIFSGVSDVEFNCSFGAKMTDVTSSSSDNGTFLNAGPKIVVRSETTALSAYVV